MSHACVAHNYGAKRQGPFNRQIGDCSSLEVLPGVTVPVATIGFLIALKLLARDDRTRPQDADDLRALIAESTDEDRREAKEAVTLIVQRGYNRSRGLEGDLEDLVRSGHCRTTS